MIMQDNNISGTYYRVLYFVYIYTSMCTGHAKAQRTFENRNLTLSIVGEENEKCQVGNTQHTETLGNELKTRLETFVLILVVYI